MIAFKLAILEFWRSGTQRAPGGRDFLWLTLLTFFLQLMAMLILSAREGVLERSVDAFLGNRDGFGIPVWTVPNMLGESQPIMVSGSMVNEIRDAGFYAAPFRRLFNAQLIRMPGRDVWKTNQRGQQSDLSGMAIDFSGPIYPQATTIPTGAPVPLALSDTWNIVLDEKIFRRQFDLARYREALTGRIPSQYLDTIPETSGRITDMSVIWLHVKVRREERLTPFKVTWARHFGVGASNTAFMIPLEMYNLYEVAKNNSRLCAFLEGGPNSAPRVLGVRSGRVFTMTAQERAAFIDRLSGLQAALGGELLTSGSRIRLVFADPSGQGARCEQGASGLLTELFLEDAGLRLQPDQLQQEPSTAPLKSTSAWVEGPCQAFGEESRARAEQRSLDGECVARLPSADSKTGYADLLVYANDRAALKPLVSFLSCQHIAASATPGEERQMCVMTSQERAEFESRLNLHEIYKDSLNRFSFLTGLLQAVTVPVGSAMLLVLVAILWVQLGTILGHRRVRYAMLLSNGLSWSQVKFIIILQGILAVSLSMLGAVLVLFLAKIAMAVQLAQMSKEYEAITFGELIDVLPVNFMTVGMVYMATLLGTVLLTALQSRLNGIRPSSPLEKLLH